VPITPKTLLETHLQRCNLVEEEEEEEEEEEREGEHLHIHASLISEAVPSPRKSALEVDGKRTL